ncbi:MAG: 6-bladed beta-propeller [Bacteroidota bacterium]
MQDVIFNPYYRAIEVYDRVSRKIIRYDLDGKFLKEWSVQIYFYSFDILDKDTYILHADGGTIENQEIEHNLLLVNEDMSKVQVKEFPIISGIDHIVSPFRISSFRENLLFTFGFSDIIYNVSLKGVRPKYYVDFGQYKLPDEIRTTAINISDEGAPMKLTNLLHSPYAKSISYLVENDRWLSFMFRYKGEEKPHVLYDKTKDEVFILDQQLIGKYFYSLPMASTPNYFLAQVPAHAFRSFVSEKALEKDVSQKILDLSSELSDYDNPIILKMRFQK